MKYDLEFYKLIKKENGIRFITFGWASDAEENPAEYLLLVNGSPQRAEFRRVRRSNICEIHSFSAASAKCGFFSDTLIPANTKSLRLMARGANETQEILRLSEEEIRLALSGSLIAYKVENYSKDSENRMAMISGWAVSLAHLPLKFHILDSENQKVPCTLRLSVRNDLLRNGLIEKEELLSGFTVYFPFEDGKTYQLLIEDGNSEERENIEVYYHEPAKGRSVGGIPADETVPGRDTVNRTAFNRTHMRNSL